MSTVVVVRAQPITCDYRADKIWLGEHVKSCLGLISYVHIFSQSELFQGHWGERESASGHSKGNRQPWRDQPQRTR